jgi:hypothetical protein
MIPPIEDAELQSRLKGLFAGPSSKHTQKAMKYLSPRVDLTPFLDMQLIPSASVSTVLARTSAKQTKELSTTLRMHWRDREGITDPKEIANRDALDEALTELQLIELAVEMGYVPEESIYYEARQRLTNMLWSDPARDFVKGYDYLSVLYLAARVGVDLGQGELVPPPVKFSAAQFATVLAEHKRWYEDTAISAWLSFLDDYIEIADEHGLVEQYFSSGLSEKAPKLTATQRKRIELLANGAYHFVVRLSGIFDLLDDDERARVGLLYSYWIAKFFGYELGDNGYAESNEGWSEDVTAFAIAWTGEDVEQKLRANLRKAWDSRIKTIADAWHAVMTLEKAMREAMEKQKPASKAVSAPVFLEIEDVTQQEWAVSPLRPLGLWQPVRSRRGFDRLGVVCVPSENVTSFPDFLAEKYARDGKLRIQVVDSEGLASAPTLVAPNDNVFSSAEALLSMEKLGFWIPESAE